jgi:hypothetical protein
MGVCCPVIGTLILLCRAPHCQRYQRLPCPQFALSPSMRRPVSVKVFSFLSEFLFLGLCLSQAASVATLPSALFCERFWLGASWVFSIQQVLLPD